MHLQCSIRDRGVWKADYTQEPADEQVANSAWTGREPDCVFEWFHWSSRKGADLYGMLHKEELVLISEILRKVSTQRREAAWAGKLASYRMYFMVNLLEEFL